MWNSQTGAVFRKELDESRIVRQDVHGPGLNFREDTFVKLLNLECHAEC